MIRDGFEVDKARDQTNTKTKAIRNFYVCTFKQTQNTSRIGRNRAKFLNRISIITIIRIFTNPVVFFAVQMKGISYPKCSNKMQKHTTIPLPFDEYPFLCSLFDVIKSQKCVSIFNVQKRKSRKIVFLLFDFCFYMKFAVFLPRVLCS